MNRLRPLYEELGILEHDLDPTPATRWVYGITVVRPGHRRPYWVFVRRDLRPVQTLTTILHEIGHIVLKQFCPAAPTYHPILKEFTNLYVAASANASEEQMANVVGAHIGIPQAIVDRNMGVPGALSAGLLNSANDTQLEAVGVLPGMMNQRLCGKVPAECLEIVRYLSALVEAEMGLAVDVHDESESSTAEARRRVSQLRTQVARLCVEASLRPRLA